MGIFSIENHRRDLIHRRIFTKLTDEMMRLLTTGSLIRISHLRLTGSEAEVDLKSSQKWPK